MLTNKQSEYSKKVVLLQTFFKALSPKEFYCILYGDCERTYLCILQNEMNSKKQRGTYKAVNGFDALVDISYKRSDVYIPPASFFSDCFRLVTLNQLFALVVDIDDLSHTGLSWLLRKIDIGKLRPTLLVNSGNGIHLYYVFDKPVDCYNYRKPILKRLAKDVQKYWESHNYSVDKKVTLIQPYRVIGALSKAGETTTGYLVGEKWKVEALAKYMQIKLWSEDKKNKLQKNSNNLAQGIINNKDIEIFPNGDRPFYNHCLTRVAEEVVEGFRYTALFALAIVAYKCRIRHEKMERDIRLCAELFNERCKPNSRIEEVEILKTLKGFSKKFVLVCSLQLEEWFGFNFPRLTKRNRRRREEHLALVREIRKEKKQDKINKIQYLLEQGYNKKEIAAMMNMSIQNLYKNYKDLFGK